MTTTVTTEDQLNAAIAAANAAANQGTIEIDVQGRVAADTNPTTVALATGNTLLIQGVPDANGVAGTIDGAGALTVASGTLTLASANGYTGGTTIDGGRLVIGTNGTAGSGTITFGSGRGTLEVDAVPGRQTTFSNTLQNFALGDAIDLRGLAFSSSAGTRIGSTLDVGTSAGSESFILAGSLPPNCDPVDDGHGGTQVTAYDWPTITGTVTGPASFNGAAISPFAGTIVSDPNPGATDTLTIALSGAGGRLSGTGLVAHQDGTYTLSGTAAAVTSALQALSFQPTARGLDSFGVTDFSFTDQSDTTNAARLVATSAVTAVTAQGTLAAAGQPIVVTTLAELDAAILGADLAPGQGAIEIDIQGKIVEDGDPLAINLAAGNTLTIKGVTDANGVAGTLDGAGSHRGLFAYQGQVAIENLTIQNARATGGAGGAAQRPGGGGAGLGGGLFVAGTADGAGAGADVTLQNVRFLGDGATGGAGGAVTSSVNGSGWGGGGGLGGAGGSSTNDPYGAPGGGGGIGAGATGAATTGTSNLNIPIVSTPGHGIVPAAAPAGSGSFTTYPGDTGVLYRSISGSPGGADGGGGGIGDGSYNFSGASGGIGGGDPDASGYSVDNFPISNGGYGGGSGGSYYAAGFGGFGGGGGGSEDEGGSGGFGGGGGAGLLNSSLSTGLGGFGAGNAGGIARSSGNPGSTGAGGGLGAGGAVFVEDGGRLTIRGGAVSGGTVAGGQGTGTGGNGQGYGSGFFLQGGSGTLTLAGGADGTTLAIADAITDQQGSAGGTNPGRSVTVGTADGTAGPVLLSGANSYSGGTTLAGGLLELDGAHAAGTGAITFAASGGGTARLVLATAAQAVGATFGNVLADFGAGDSLDLAGFSFNAATASITASGGQFTVTDASGRTETFRLGGAAPQAGALRAQSDGAGGTLIEDIVCFVSGTLIRTLRGDVAVEDLAVGDLAVTASGEHRPVRWIGHRTMDCRDHPRPHEVMPVRVQAGALGPNRPGRDLWVSPGHALCLDVLGEVFVPVSSLINGATVAQADVDTVTYWHVELDTHDVLIADGQPAESYMDCGNRTFFGTGEGVVDPDRTAGAWADYCRPFHLDGPLVAAVRSRLKARAVALGWSLDAAPLAGLHLVADGVRIAAEVEGLRARFLVPATARDVWLVSDTFVPRDLGTDVYGDQRRLGLCVRALTVDDGLGTRHAMAHDDDRLADGFHAAEADHRWTDGCARLPAALWDGCKWSFFLRVDFAGPSEPRWVAPRGMEMATSPATEPAPSGLRLIRSAA